MICAESPAGEPGSVWPLRIFYFFLMEVHPVAAGNKAEEDSADQGTREVPEPVYQGRSN